MEGWTALTGRPSRPGRNRDPPGVKALYAGMAEDNPKGDPPSLLVLEPADECIFLYRRSTHGPHRPPSTYPVLFLHFEAAP